MESSIPQRKKQNDSLKKELSRLKKSGVYLELNGDEKTPGQISKAHKVAENGSYMRDYIVDEQGGVKEIHFQWIREEP